MKVFEIGSEYDWDSTSPYLRSEENKFYQGKNIHTLKLLRSGRDAIRYIAKAYRYEKKTVLMPALCCSCMPEPFEDEGYEVIYYKLTADFKVDIEDVLQKIKPDSIFLFMNYFAISSLNKDDREKIVQSKKGVITLEDITHDFLKRDIEKCEADITICSIRKWFSIPDGGLLFSGLYLPQLNIECDSYFAEKRMSAMKRKNIYLEGGRQEEKNIFRIELMESNHFIDTTKNVAAISKTSIEVLTHIDLIKMYKDRLVNSKLLYEKLSNVKNIRLVGNKSVDSTLYLPILVTNQKEIQERLAEKGVYAPVIWPLPKRAEGLCRTADEVALHMLGIPCDHRYTKKEMIEVAEIIREVVD